MRSHGSVRGALGGGAPLAVWGVTGARKECRKNRGKAYTERGILVTGGVVEACSG